MSEFPYQTHNWLIHKLMWEHLSSLVPRFASGVLLDVGCGARPYHALVSRYASSYVGLDYPVDDGEASAADVLADAMTLPIATGSVDTVLCSEVLEHLPRPLDAIREFHRVLRPEGCVIITTPLFWQVHEEPRDFYRYTRYGLHYLLEEGGLAPVHTAELTGFVATFAQLGSYFLHGRGSWATRWLTTPLVWMWQRLAYWLNRYDRSRRFNCLTIVVGQKPGAAA